ncbi:MAG TPA: RidA family protein [Anaerolineae bacterium]
MTARKPAAKKLAPRRRAVARPARRVIHTDSAPRAIGPYSQAIRTGSLVYTAGQVAIDPAVGKLIEGGIEDQARRALNNIKAVLEAAGTSLERVAKTTVFMVDLGQFAAMNAVYAEFFPANPPARSTVQVAALPLGALVEIEAVAECAR